jgi:hypothetical protein
MVALESDGFDGDVYIIIQPRGKFYDYSDKNKSIQLTMIYSNFYGTTFFVPSAYDVLVYF